MRILTYSIILLITATAVYLLYPEQKLNENAKIDYILVKKSEHKMEVCQNGELIKTYKISLGRNPIGHKEFEGYGKTPEGIF